MTNVFGEPFVLASYSASQKFVLSGSKEPFVYAKYSKGTGRSDGYVTVTAQGDGVHVLNVRGLLD
jgi:hypothetical protein